MPAPRVSLVDPSATTPPYDHLLAAAFERCASRLTEMQSSEYFAHEHHA